MRGRLAYRKMMLFHNILTSDDKRVIKKILHIQKQEERETTWYSSVQKEIRKYGIELDAPTSLKSRWKKHVKRKINEQMEKEIRQKCESMTKGRSVMYDEYNKKDYLGNVNMVETKKILRVRTHMSMLPANYKEGGEGICLLCNDGKGVIEHYFECYHTKGLARVWKVELAHLKSLEPETMKSVANFVESVENLLKPLMDHRL